MNIAGFNYHPQIAITRGSIVKWEETRAWVEENMLHQRYDIRYSAALPDALAAAACDMELDLTRSFATFVEYQPFAVCRNGQPGPPKERGAIVLPFVTFSRSMQPIEITVSPATIAQRVAEFFAELRAEQIPVLPE